MEGRGLFLLEPPFLEPRLLVWVQRVFWCIPASGPASVREGHGCPWALHVCAAGLFRQGAPQQDLVWFGDQWVRGCFEESQ